MGTRILPATKAQPKEMLPIVDKPAIQYIVEEAVQAGIESILIVTGRNKKAIEDHFDKSVELEQILEGKGKFELLEQIRGINHMANIHYIRQQEPLGLGHAILCAQPFVGDEPFAVLLGDDIMVSETSPLQEMMQLFELHDKQIVGVQSVPLEEVNKYGIITPESRQNRIYSVSDLVEKPRPEQAPSHVAIMGRYILKPSVFQALQTIEKGAGNEYQLTDALREICLQEGLMALELDGERYDIGDKFGYMKAFVELGMRRKEMRPLLLDYLEEIVRRERSKEYFEDQKISYSDLSL
ncbi:UTP--glucose-1-phosphate uridylyltransferase GalU [Paenibacillus sp. P25]|nr:UTP--glucose-1-phosphate uridylyltransferase GalU [Paenibacillus sp. P25]